MTTDPNPIGVHDSGAQGSTASASRDALSMASDITVEEIMATAIASRLRDGDVCFIGIATGGRAFTMAVGIPAAACRLAQLTHAPNLLVMFGWVVDASVEHFPNEWTDAGMLGWRSKAQLPVHDALDIFKRGKMDVGFVSSAQVDQFGNLNIVQIGRDDPPSVRLPGPLAQTTHCATAGRTITVVPHERRRFVERVDYISGAGYLDGGEARQRYQLRGKGPDAVVTDLAVMDFDPVTKRMRVASLHPGVTPEQVQDATGFDLGLSEIQDIPATALPTMEQLRLLREVIDPSGRLLRQG